MELVVQSFDKQMEG